MARNPLRLASGLVRIEAKRSMPTRQGGALTQPLRGTPNSHRLQTRTVAMIGSPE